MNLFDAIMRTLMPDSPPAASGFPTRRAMLGGALLGSFFADSASAEEATPRSLSPERWLVNRLTYGPNTFDLNKADTLGYQGYLDWQLDYAAINDYAAVEQRLALYSILQMTPAQIASITQPSYIFGQLYEATILRATLSKRQLFQRMVEFWTDHFNIDLNKSYCPWLKMIDDRDVIRIHALGRFRDLLGASAHSPAMMDYLDNHISRVGNPNENYARELLELHTMGVDGGYTQQDVVEVARCLTGWGYHPYFPSVPPAFEFRYSDAYHDQGEKVVLGQTIPAGGGMSDVETVLDILCAHPSTANFISKKLCKFFYSEDPPQSLVDAVSATYTSTSGDIKEMVRTLFMTAIPAEAPLKFKRPFHHIISSMRASAATIGSTVAIRASLSNAGHLPFTWPRPDGFPDEFVKWADLLLPRWNFGSSLVQGQVTSVTFDPVVFFTGAVTADDVMNLIEAKLFSGSMSTFDKDRIRSHVAQNPSSVALRNDALALAIGSPGFQFH
jgi:uncharacterized protein (DUF1800 family)